jgi:hypothetical protein
MAQHAAHDVLAVAVVVRYDGLIVLPLAKCAQVEAWEALLEVIQS